MKKLLVSLFALVSLTTTGCGSDQPTELEFIEQTRELYPDMAGGLSQQEVVNMGLEVCLLLDEGNTPEGLIFTKEEGMVEKARTFIDLAVRTYCPEHGR